MKKLYFCSCLLLLWSFTSAQVSPALQTRLDQQSGEIKRRLDERSLVVGVRSLVTLTMDYMYMKK